MIITTTHLYRDASTRRSPDSLLTGPSSPAQSCTGLELQSNSAQDGLLKKIISPGSSKTQKKSPWSTSHRNYRDKESTSKENQAVALFFGLVHPAFWETSQAGWQSPGPAHQQCHFWLSPCSLLAWILTQNLFCSRKLPGTDTGFVWVFFFKLVLLHLQWQHPGWGTYGKSLSRGSVLRHGVTLRAFWRVWGVARAPASSIWDAF